MIPQPIDANIIRNYTAFAAHDVKSAKQRLLSEDFFKDFPIENLPDEINEIDDILRQHMFAAWLNGNDEKFNKLKNKFESLDQDENVPVTKLKYVDPSQTAEAHKSFGDLIFNVEFNKTHEMHLVVPEDLKEALFDGWQQHGMNFVRVLSHYGEKFILNLKVNLYFNLISAKSLEVRPSIFVGNTRYVFKPPQPSTYSKKSVNGFIYVKWRKLKLKLI